MNRYKQAPTLVKIRTILVIILSALLAAVILELILAERTNALLKETLQGTTSVLRQVIAPVIPSAPSPAQNVLPPAQPVSSSPPSSPAAATVASSPNESPAAAPTNKVAPITHTDLQKIYFSKAKMSESITAPRFTKANDYEPSPSSFAWIQATERGWKVAGLLWYWWMAGVMTVFVGIMIWRRSLKTYLVNKWLARQYVLYAE